VGVPGETWLATFDETVENGKKLVKVSFLISFSQPQIVLASHVAKLLSMPTSLTILYRSIVEPTGGTEVHNLAQRSIHTKNNDQTVTNDFLLLKLDTPTTNIPQATSPAN